MMDMAKIREELDDDRIMYLRAHEDSTADLAADVLAGLARQGDRVVFLSTAKPAMTRQEDLREQDITDDNVFFIDGSNIDDDQVRQENMVFVNPKNLTHLSISMNEAVEQLSGDGPVIVVIDALTSLSMYHEEKPLRQFLHTFCAKMRGKEAPAIIISIEDSISERLDASIAQFADRTLDWN